MNKIKLMSHLVADYPTDELALTAACKENGMINIPVAAPSMSPERLDKLAHAGFPYIYAALRVGITGTDTKIDQPTLDFLSKVSAGGSKVYGGFGISSGEQSAALGNSVDAVVAGSVFVRIITKNKDSKEKLYEAVKAKAKEITHS